VTDHAAGPFARETSLGYQVNYLARLLAQALHERIAPLGVVPGQFAQLLTLYAEDGLTQRELCDRVGIEQPTMANTLQRMERDGLIRREPDPADGRRARVLLTDRARDLEAPLVAAAQDVNALATKGLDQREVAALLHAVSRVVANLEAGADAEPARRR
jgi:DNA-binding MarR family transcriptional regulator